MFQHMVMQSMLMTTKTDIFSKNILWLLTHLPLNKNGCHLADDNFRCLYIYEKSCILTKISLRFVPKGPIGNNPSIGLDNGLAPNRWWAIMWTNADPNHWHIYVALRGDELKIFNTFWLIKGHHSKVSNWWIWSCEISQHFGSYILRAWYKTI